MAKHASFNPSLTMPIIDIIVAIILISTTGYFWFQTKGEEKLAEARAGLRTSRAENRALLEETHLTKIAAQQELQETIVSRDENAQLVEFLKDRIEVERETILDARARDERYTDEMLDLRTEIQRTRDRRRAFTTDIFEAEGEIERVRGEVAALEAQVTDRNDQLARLDVWIVNAHEAQKQNPPSRYPEKSALATLLDVNQDQQSVLVNLSHEVRQVGRLDIGLMGSLGLSTDGESSTKEGGLYANLPLRPRRASIDFEGGVSQLQSRKQDVSETGPYAGATVRFAPKVGERLFLVGGTRYSHEDLAVRLGLALGRR